MLICDDRNRARRPYLKNNQKKIDPALVEPTLGRRCGLLALLLLLLLLLLGRGGAIPDRISTLLPALRLRLLLLALRLLLLDA